MKILLKNNKVLFLLGQCASHGNTSKTFQRKREQLSTIKQKVNLSNRLFTPSDDLPPKFLRSWNELNPSIQGDTVLDKQQLTWPLSINCCMAGSRLASSSVRHVYFNIRGEEVSNYVSMNCSLSKKNSHTKKTDLYQWTHNFMVNQFTRGKTTNSMPSIGVQAESGHMKRLRQTMK